MPLKDILKKKNTIAESATEKTQAPTEPPAVPEFTIYRTDTNTQEVIQPPSFTEDNRQTSEPSDHVNTNPSRLSLSRLRKSSSASITSRPSDQDPKLPSRKLSQRLHLSRASSSSSVNVPSDLPTIPDAYRPAVDDQENEAQWEERATRLAKEDGSAPRGKNGSRPLSTPDVSGMNITEDGNEPASTPRLRASSVSDAAGDENIQEAIRLHEAGELTKAAQMFGRLAETGNVLSQVLYGLSLRHGWGIRPDPAKAVSYLRSAASNSAAIEADALKAGMKKGGAAKGELVLAIFELANCFRNGWGVEVDKPAARQYYETAANLGDTDAMNEAAWCYLEGFGGKKDRFKAALLLRLAEQSGSKTLGNSWIWKEKYNPK